MSRVFADTGYWIALVYSRDRWHEIAVSFARNMTEQQVSILTSEMVLVEFMNFFSRSDVRLRTRAANWVIYLQNSPDVEIIPQSSEQFDRAVRFYIDRADQPWSLTDCSSFLIMTELNITDALVHDKHFEQAGFGALLRQT